ncbi:hypothetical protein [Chryseobacterium sp. M5A1_1a]
MKKFLLPLLFFSSMTFAQFTISESSNDWALLGKEKSNTSILVNGERAKLRMIDFRSKTMGFDPLSTFKSQGQRNIDNLQGEIKKGNEGVKAGYFEFEFSIKPDTLDKLYEVIKSHFESKTKESITLSFPEGNLYLDFNSKTMFYAVSFGIESNGQKIYSAPMVKNQIDKIFGKKD